MPFCSTPPAGAANLRADGRPFVPTPSEHRHAQKASRGSWNKWGAPRPALMRPLLSCPTLSLPDVGGNRLCRESPLMASSMAIGWHKSARNRQTEKSAPSGAPFGLRAKRSVWSSDCARLRRLVVRAGGLSACPVVACWARSSALLSLAANSPRDSAAVRPRRLRRRRRTNTGREAAPNPYQVKCCAEGAPL